MIKLKICPFCGHEFQIVECNSYGYSDKGERNKYGVQHVLPDGEDCPISTNNRMTIGRYCYDTKKELMSDWNKRFKDGEKKEKSNS